MDISVTRVEHMLQHVNNAGSAMYEILKLADKYPKVEPVLENVQEIIDLLYELEVQLNVIKQVDGDIDKYYETKREYELNLWKQMMENFKKDN